VTTQAVARDGRHARWDRHKEERRQQIIDATTAAVEEAGPGAEIHVQQIADHDIATGRRGVGEVRAELTEAGGR
jgi:hypothetical protein